ncbi:hypothetical protein O1611_g719 [Lasiodiplodia mahajangana]|uniref:Uncharacterized protein n=1 Tax=Lasiodiplodia mahajangana TaxID=1108764 RepID=A0ACC2JZG4_9PEZI|nr:hypothetical protein O1611_g719 [Lasiodiplodia mahajangana]
MSFQLSIGDGILLAQIAWKLAQAFTKGRHSAPAEFLEVENELYSLSSALTAALTERDSLIVATESQAKTAQDVFGRVIQNCSKTLTHIEHIVNKYVAITTPDDPTKPRRERWSSAIVKNWKKIEWTTEKGNLDALRNQLTVHINSLNLFINIATSLRTLSIERSLEKMSMLFEELHQWYVDNLKDVSSPAICNQPSNITPTSPGNASFATAPIFVSTFELARENEYGIEPICPRASLRNEWIESSSNNLMSWDLGSLFKCRCSHDEDRALSHELGVQGYGLSHLIFPIRIASNDPSWILYKAADTTNNQLVNLHIRRIHPGAVRYMEDVFFHSLAVSRADALLSECASNSLCYVCPETRQERLLTSMSDLRISQTSIESVALRSNRTEIVREWVNDVQILQYGTLERGISNYGTRSSPSQIYDYAEVLFSYGGGEPEDQGDIVSTTLNLKCGTVVNLTDRASVEISSIEATDTYLEDQTKTITALDVLVQFTTRAAAKEFHKNLEAMRTELFVTSLRYPRSNEKVILNLRNRCTILSQVLVNDFFTFPTIRPNFTGPTDVVQIESTGERKVHHYAGGLRNLSLSTNQGNRMLKLAQSSIAIGVTNEHPRNTNRGPVFRG